MQYEFKQLPELGWFAVVAAATFLLVLAADFDVDTVTDWRAYGIAAGSGMLRAAAAAVLAVIGRRPA